MVNVMEDRASIEYRGTACDPRTSALKSIPSPNGSAFIRTSVALQRLYDGAPAEHFTLGWVMASLRKRSFGMIMLLLSLAAVVPGVSIVAGVVLLIPACP